MTDNHVPPAPPTPSYPPIPPPPTTDLGDWVSGIHAQSPVAQSPTTTSGAVPPPPTTTGSAAPSSSASDVLAVPRALRLRGAIRHVFDERFSSAAVALVGPNGSGKTSRSIAVALPLEGSRHGGGDPADLAPLGMDFAYSAIDFSDGRSYQFDTRVQWRKPEGAPEAVRPATWLVAKGKAGVLAEVVARWGGAEAAAALAAPDSLTDPQKKLWDTTVDMVRRAVATEKKSDPTGDYPDDPATILGMVAATMGRLKLAKGKDAKGYQASIEAVAQEDVIGTEDESRIAADLAYARRWESSQRDRARAEKLQAAIAAYQQAVTKFGELPPIADRVPIREAYETAAKRLAAEEVAQTFYYEMIRRLSDETGEILPGVPFSVIQGFQRFDLYNIALAAWRAVEQTVATAREARDRASAQLVEIDEAQKWRDADRDRLGAEHARLAAESKDLAAVLAGLDHVPTESVAALEKKLDAIKAAVERKKVKTKLIGQKNKADEDLHATKAVEQAAKIAYITLAGLVQGRLNTAVTARLPLQYQDRFHFDLAKGRLEMRGNDGRPHDWRNQGGGEYVALTLALARAWAADRRGVLLLEYERDLAALSTLPGPGGAPSVLATVLRGLAEAAYRGEIAMVLIASPVPLPLDDLWQVIETHVPVQVVETSPIAASVVEPIAAASASVGPPAADADLEERLRASMPPLPPLPSNVIPFAPIAPPVAPTPPTIAPTARYEGTINYDDMAPPLPPPPEAGSQLALPSMDDPAPLPLSDVSSGAFLTNEPPPLPLRAPPSGLSPDLGGAMDRAWADSMGRASTPPTRQVLDRLTAQNGRSDADLAALAALHEGEDGVDDDESEAAADGDADGDALEAAAAKAVKSSRRKKSPKSSTRRKKK